MENKRKITTYDLTTIGIMAAFVYVSSYMRINIPTPIGKTGIHFGNIFCLLSGLLLGPLRGGLAAGMGSAIFDLTSDYVTSAPFTLVFKFAMAWACGLISHSGGRQATNKTYNLIGGVTGAVLYVILYIGKNMISGYFFMHNPTEVVIADAIAKGSVSLANGLIAVVFSFIFFPVFKNAMQRTGVYAKLFPPKEIQAQQ